MNLNMIGKQQFVRHIHLPGTCVLNNLVTESNFCTFPSSLPVTDYKPILAERDNKMYTVLTRNYLATNEINKKCRRRKNQQMTQV